MSRVSPDVVLRDGPGGVARPKTERGQHLVTFVSRATQRVANGMCVVGEGPVVGRLVFALCIFDGRSSRGIRNDAFLCRDRGLFQLSFLPI